MNKQDLNLLKNPFLYTESEVRTALDSSGNPWFCAKDVCLALDISWSGSGNTLRSMPERWVMVSYHETIKGERETIFINEAGLYKLIFRSSKPKAEEFANWVCEVVLPELRRNGFFGVLSPSAYLSVVKMIVELTGQVVNTKNRFQFDVLVAHLRTLCNMAGQPMPDLKRLALQLDQADLFDGGAQ